MPGTAATVAHRAMELLVESAACPSGNLSPSIYETGRIAVLAPWVAGQDGRLRFLLAAQGADGTWGEFDSYTLIPTLSATEALLVCLLRRAGSEPLRGRLAAAAVRGLRALTKILDPTGNAAVADTIAAELIVPALLHDIHEHLARLSDEPVAGLDGWANVRFASPAIADPDLLRRIRTQPSELPAKLSHTLEIVGSRAPECRAIRPVNGNVGCSPAATAAWLGPTAPAASRDPSATYLNDLATRHGGPVPGVSPITTFEYAWSVNTLLSVGMDIEVPDAITTYLAAALTHDGAGVAPGLLCDADTTAVVLATRTLLGGEPRLDCLRPFDRGTYFVCWDGERNPSISANAHVLECLADEKTVMRHSEWLRAHQHADGHWLDKWHASPYYATHCCVRALGRVGIVEPVDRARRWVLDTQRADGSWGLWCGTREETAYAVQILLRGRRGVSGEVREAADRGRAFLLSCDDSDDLPLWHDKDLYAPINVIRAEVLAALYLADLLRQSEEE
jgi:hypothetical protein